MKMEIGPLPPTDRELVRKARHGELDAFHALVDRHAPFLYGMALSMVGNTADAEDLVQETLTGAFRGLASFREESSARTWLSRILIRQVARHFRRSQSLRLRVLGRAQAPLPAKAAATTRSDIAMDVGSCLMELNPEHREVIVLRELQGMSYDEIAAVLEIPRGTVESRLFRARKELQELLQEYR